MERPEADSTFITAGETRIAGRRSFLIGGDGASGEEDAEGGKIGYYDG